MPTALELAYLWNFNCVREVVATIGWHTLHGQSVAPPSAVRSSNRGLSHQNLHLQVLFHITWLIFYNLTTLTKNKLLNFEGRECWVSDVGFVPISNVIPNMYNVYCNWSKGILIWKKIIINLPFSSWWNWWLILKIRSL